MNKSSFYLAAALGAAACDKPAPTVAPESATAPTTVPSTTEEEPTPEPWVAVSDDALSASDTALLERGTLAKGELGAALIGALGKSIAADGFAASVEFCQGEAPGLASTIGEKHGVRIGRTSHKLRNPRNAPPAWAADVVGAATAGPHVFRSPTGTLGVLSPIATADMCVNCHGSVDKLADGVADALARDYPDDHATGFASGDLRGWFWFEVDPG